MKTKKILFISYMLVIAALVVTVWILSHHRHDRDTALTDFLGSWAAEDGREVSLDYLHSPGPNERTMTLKHFLPNTMGVDDQLNLVSHNIFFEVSVDGHSIYWYYPEENLTGRGYGDQVHYIPIPKDGTEIRISYSFIYDKDNAGYFRTAYIGSQTAFVSKILQEHGLAFALSVLIILFGLFAIVIHFGSYGMGVTRHHLPAIGIAVILLGLWSAVKTTVPMLWFDNINLLRAIDYGALAFVAYPLVVFINSVAEKKRKIYEIISFFITISCGGTMILLRFVNGVDMHYINFLNLISTGCGLILIAWIVIDDAIYCRGRSFASSRFIFYIGTLVFEIGAGLDLVLYFMTGQTSKISGICLQFGLILLILLMIIQVLRNMILEHRSFDRQKFVNNFLQYSLSGSSPEETIHHMLKYLGEELDADRAYIFEDMEKGYFANTYEWCRPGVEPQIDNLKHVPFVGVLDAWYREFDRNGYVIIEDIEEYKEVNETIYNILKPQEIRTLVTGPLEFDGRMLGFFGVDNPPKERVQSISKILQLLQYFISVIVRQRDTQDVLYKYSYVDSLTGVMNRRALDERIEEEIEESQFYGLLMCDINGLKKTNDEQGHLVGDMMIQEVADCLSKTFGSHMVFRMGGDEFLAISTNKTRDEFDNCVETLRKEIEDDGNSASFGVAFCDTEDQHFDQVLKLADDNMYSDKRMYYDIIERNRRRE